MTHGELTARQRDVLRAIATLENAGELVTLQRVAAELELPRQNIWSYVHNLQERGLVVYNPTERFTTPIRLSDTGWEVSEVPRAAARDLRFPILGEIAAGQPTLAEGQVEAYATRLQDVLDLREGDFLLRVRGESMIGIGIYPGDLVAIHPQHEEPHSGEIMLVLVPGENTATLKRWFRDNGTVTLVSENPDFKPMTFPTEDVRIQGCLVGHIGTGRSRRNPER
ncbi:LexA repressor [Deinococcus aerius]|uniref:LexA repressor n=1 Tax=Deinococcus aerius TaxID=200253 RepID=A0A2I9DP78_9DEIO|nr:S24 family peptidase [Deinococcus aerius]GBF03897.1 LexA repressor [Deinococcus aerius]